MNLTASSYRWGEKTEKRRVDLRCCRQKRVYILTNNVFIQRKSESVPTKGKNAAAPEVLCNGLRLVFCVLL